MFPRKLLGKATGINWQGKAKKKKGKMLGTYENNHRVEATDISRMPMDPTNGGKGMVKGQFRDPHKRENVV